MGRTDLLGLALLPGLGACPLREASPEGPYVALEPQAEGALAGGWERDCPVHGGLCFRGDPLFARVENRVIATARRSLEAAAAVCAAQGIAPVILGDDITGEASEVAASMAAQVRAAPRRSVLISGGECTVTLRGAGGRGGRCAEFLLALAIALDGAQGVHAIAADTDGIDGSEDNAGALLAPDTLARASAKGIDAKKMLAANDSYGFFAALGDLVVTGPTRTNVNDYRAILLAQVGKAGTPCPSRVPRKRVPCSALPD